MEGRRSLRTRKTVVPKVEPKPPSKVKKTPKKRQKIVLPIYSSGESSFELTTTSVQRTSSRPVRKSTRRKTTKARPPSSDEDFELESPPSKKKKPVSRRKTIAAVSKTTTSKTKPTTNLVLKRARKKKAVILSPEEAIQAAMDRFHASSVPDELPCREQQLEAITSFVEQKLDDGEGGCMYISGVPGTGKTTTLYEVKRQLEHRRDELPEFKFVEINGVRLGDPRQFYPQLHMELTGQRRSVSQALNALNDRFTNDRNPNKTATILVVDELDYLRTKGQHLLYNIFDWPTRANSRLIVLAIANTMDLPERLDMLKFSSRIAFARQSFSPYNFRELEAIVASRLADLSCSKAATKSVFEPDALQLICRKVAAHSGDARRVLDIGRRSTEIAIGGSKTRVTMADVNQALAEIFSSINVYRVSHGSEAEQTFLRALLAEFRASGLEEARFVDVYSRYVEICRLEGLSKEAIPTTTQVAKVAANLDLSKVVLFQKSPSHLYRRLSLLISADDVAFALNIVGEEA